MTTYTTADLATRLLRDLGLIGAEETPSAPDVTWANETIQAEIESMSAENIKLWGGSYVSIPGEYFTPLSARIGIAVAPAFGLITLAEAELGKEALNKRLRKISAVPATGERAESEYF